jgi:hypothetical protein
MFPDSRRIVNTGFAHVAWRYMRSLAVAAAFALLLKLSLALLTVGTNDVATFDHDLATIKSVGFAQLYRDGVTYASPVGEPVRRFQPFIHPPAIVNALLAFGALQDASGLPLGFWVRFLCAIADLGTLVVLWMMFRDHGGKGPLYLLALSPVSILISGFHGNTDPIFICFVVLSVFLVERNRPGWAGAAFGVAASIKLVPIMFAPAILLSLPDLRGRLKWLGIAAGTWLALAMPYFALQPGLILRTILGYEGTLGAGLLFTLAAVLGDARFAAFYKFYAPIARFVPLLAAALVPLVMKRFHARLSLFEQCGMAAFLFLFLAPGFGPQYLAWTVPWVIALGFEATLFYYVITGAALLGVYVKASGGFVIHAYGNFFFPEIWTTWDVLGLAPWIAMGVIVFAYARLARSTRLPARSHGVHRDNVPVGGTGISVG